MEKIIFRSYLNFAKKEDRKLWRSLMKMPLKLKFLFCIAFLFDVLMLISIVVPNIQTVVFGILMVIPVVIVIVLFYQVEFYKIEHAEDSCDEYIKYCTNLKEWLFEKWVSSKDEVETIIKRMKKIISKEKKEREKFSSKVFGVFQILVIPIILLTITSYVDNESNFIAAFSNIMGVSVIIMVFLCFFGLIWNLYSSVKVKKVAQMERFVDDLQSVLDICFYNIYKGKEQKIVQSEINEEVEKTKE